MCARDTDASRGNSHDSLDGKHLYYDATVNAGSISWNCHSDDLKQKWCPGNCTCTG